MTTHCCSAEKMELRLYSGRWMLPGKLDVVSEKVRVHGQIRTDTSQLPVLTKQLWASGSILLGSGFLV